MRIRKANKPGRVTVELGAADESLMNRGAAASPGRFQLKTILVPVDFSSFSNKALDYALAFAEQFGAKVTLLHVVEPMVYPESYVPTPAAADELNHHLITSAEQRLARQREALGEQGAEVRTVARAGRPFIEICEFAREAGVDLIILATHGYTGLKHVLLGSTAERVVRHSPCPVLTVRAEEQDFVALRSP
jgi:nucleotide-binding universal stress UspA family protein